MPTKMQNPSGTSLILSTEMLPGHHFARLQASNEMMVRSSVEELVGSPEAHRAKVLIVTPRAGRITAEHLAQLSELRLVASFGVGFDHIDVVDAMERGVYVTNSPPRDLVPVAELAIAFITALARQLTRADRLVRSGGWVDPDPFGSFGEGLFGRRLGLIGLGRAGSVVARVCGVLGMKITYWQPRRLEGSAEELLHAEYAELPALLRSADFVSLHCPLTPETRHLIDRKAIALMKKTAYLVNTSRGGIVDEAALVEALGQGRIAGAGLDVFEFEPDVPTALRDLQTVLLSPHIGGATQESRLAMSDVLVEQVDAVLGGRQPPNWVNRPIGQPPVARQ